MKKALSFVVLGLVMLLLVACGQSGQQATPSSSSNQATTTASEATSDSKEIPTIRIGGGFATEEPLWLMFADPSKAPNVGKTYVLDFTQFRANVDRMNAYQAGQVDMAINGQGATIVAAAQGIPLKVIASMAKESVDGGFNSRFLALKDSGINSVEDLKGKTIGIPDFKTPTDMWARKAVETGGLDPDRDVQFAVIPIPSMGEAIKSQKIDVGMFPQPFSEIADRSGEYVEVFNSKTGVPVEEDFLVVLIEPNFLKENEQAVRDFLADFVAATKYYNENSKEARQILLDANMVQAEPDIYLELTDYKRVPDVLNIQDWEYYQELLLEEGWIDQPVDLSEIIDTSYLP